MRNNTTIEDVCGVIGFSATMRLIVWYGGKNLYVPSRIEACHVMIAVLGKAATTALIQEFGSETIWVPKNPINQYRKSFDIQKLVAQKLAEKKKTQSIANDAGITARQVQRIQRYIKSAGIYKERNFPENWPPKNRGENAAEKQG